MRPLHIISQDVITRGHDLTGMAGANGVAHSSLESNYWKDQVADLEQSADIKETRPLLFCSLAIAAYITRNCPELARGVILPRRFLAHHHYSALLPSNALLNTGGIYLPWGHIDASRARLRDLFPAGVFIRPDSSMKPFTGFAVDHDHLAEEWRAMGIAAKIQATEMCYVGELLDLPREEYRCWIVDGEVATSASYGWEEGAEDVGAAPKAIVQAAEQIARRLEMVEQIFTADFVATNQGVKLVELNALSTSGWYSGMDPKALINAMEMMLI